MSGMVEDTKNQGGSTPAPKCLAHDNDKEPFEMKTRDDSLIPPFFSFAEDKSDKQIDWTLNYGAEEDSDKNKFEIKSRGSSIEPSVTLRKKDSDDETGWALDYKEPFKKFRDSSIEPYVPLREEDFNEQFDWKVNYKSREDFDKEPFKGKVENLPYISPSDPLTEEDFDSLSEEEEEIGFADIGEPITGIIRNSNKGNYRTAFVNTDNENERNLAQELLVQPVSNKSLPEPRIRTFKDIRNFNIEEAKI